MIVVIASWIHRNCIVLMNVRIASCIAPISLLSFSEYTRIIAYSNTALTRYMKEHVDSRVYHLPRCEVFLCSYHALYLWKQIGIFHFQKSFVPTHPLATKDLKLQWEVKK